MLFEAEFWIVIAVVLCGLEIFTGTFISLSLGLSALIMAGLLTFFPNFIPNWYVLFLVYGLFGLVFSIGMWYFFGKKHKQPDIND